MIFSRMLGTHILEAARNLPVVLLTGALQVGKPTLLQGLCTPEQSYVTLDDPLTLSLAREDPALLFLKSPVSYICFSPSIPT